MTSDEYDEAIIELLQADPQRSNKSVAQALSITESAVAVRIRTLMESNAIRFVAQRDIVAFGASIVAHADIYVGGRKATDVAAEIGRIEHVASVVILAGSPQIIAQIHAADGPHLTEIIEREISAVAGIERIETIVSMEVLKYRTDIAELGAQHD